MRPLAVLACLFPMLASAQPFIDLFGTNTLVSRGLDRVEAGGTLPLRLDTTGRLLLLDPYFVQWHTTTNGDLYTPANATAVRETMRGTGGAITYVTPIGAGRWKLAVAGIGRFNWLEQPHNSDIQYGGVVLASRVFRPTLTLRLGTYANYDAFGWFVLPLLGIDWRIDARHNVFGTLPGSLTYEHKATSRFHWGASFRAYTTSFGPRGGNYRRIDENPLGVYADLYITRSIVLRLEGGWSFIRDVLGGPADPLYSPERVTRQGYADHSILDAPYARCVIAYRLRLDPTPPR